MMKNFASFVFLVICAPHVLANGDGEEKDYKSHWVAHGVCASIAWTILVPIAVGASLLRKQLKQIGFSDSAWFQLHRTLNLTAALLTIIAFAIAVYVIRAEDGKSNWSEYTHFTVGLVILIATLAQSISGLLRPPLKNKEEVEKKEDEATEVEDTKIKDTPAKPAAAKSTLRRVWEVKHRLLGIGLLATSWWQVRSGWELMEEEVGGEDLGIAFMGVAGGIAGTVAIIYVVQAIRTPHPVEVE